MSNACLINNKKKINYSSADFLHILSANKKWAKFEFKYFASGISTQMNVWPQNDPQLVVNNVPDHNNLIADDKVIEKRLALIDVTIN